MEGALERNSKESGAWYELNRIHSPDEKQKEITEKWILPYEEMITGDLRLLRKEVDTSLKKDPETRATEREPGRESYPIGFCRAINEQVFELIKKRMQDRSYPGLQAVKNFVREGGIIQTFWGVDKDMYFQNGIQIGNALMDVSNDTVDRTKEPIVFYPDLKEAPLKGINSVEKYAEIAEKYWGYDVYPNIYLPYFSPVFPVITIQHTKWRGGGDVDILKLDSELANLFLPNYRTLKEGHIFGLSSDFLFESAYSQKRLPDDVFQKFFSKDNKLMTRLDHFRPDAFRMSTDPEEAKASFDRFQLSSGEKIPKEYLDKFMEIIRLQRKVRGGIVAVFGR